jgi:predicted dinucleotide-binding enzyme
MRIGIIGAGNIGATLARLFVQVGHEVAISNSRGPASLAGLVGALGPNAQAMTVQDAAAFGDLVVEAIPFGRYRDLPVAQLAGKILVTASNYYEQRDGAIDFGGKSQSEFLAEYLTGVRVVKAFNTIWYQHLQQQGDTARPYEQRRVIFLAGDDAEAKQVVADLIAQLGFGPLDIGSLHDSAKQEPGQPIYNNDLTVAEAREMLARRMS